MNEKKEETKDYSWMLRPCMIYKSEYDDCTSIKARFNQYFIFGEYLDCTQWYTDYQNCYQWEKHKSQEAYEKLIESEKQRRLTRLRSHQENNIWERREQPPADWNSPLPEWLEKKFEASYLQIRSQEMKQGIEASSLDSKCTIL